MMSRTSTYNASCTYLIQSVHASSPSRCFSAQSVGFAFPAMFFEKVFPVRFYYYSPVCFYLLVCALILVHVLILVCVCVCVLVCVCVCVSVLRVCVCVWCVVCVRVCVCVC